VKVLQYLGYWPNTTKNAKSGLSKTAHSIEKGPAKDSKRARISARSEVVQELNVVSLMVFGNNEWNGLLLQNARPQVSKIQTFMQASDIWDWRGLPEEENVRGGLHAVHGKA
jgi:hypothetical protein